MFVAYKAYMDNATENGNINMNIGKICWYTCIYYYLLFIAVSICKQNDLHTCSKINLVGDTSSLGNCS